MANLKKTLPSGAELEVSIAPIVEVHALWKAAAHELETVRIDALVGGTVTPAAIDAGKNLVARLIASDAIDKALWPCMARATYNGQKITKDTFEPEAARIDFLDVQEEVLVHNLRPFFIGLASRFTGLVELLAASRKSPSTPTTS